MADEFMSGFMAGQNDNGGNRGGGMFGGEGIWAIVLIALIFGGGNAFGGFGGGNNGASGALTRADLCDGFNFNNVENGIRGIQNGLCDGFYAQNTTMLQGFNSIGNGLSNIGNQISSCCCETNRNIDAVRYENAKNTCDIIQNAHNDADRIIGVLTQDKIESLRTELQSAQLQLSNAAQTNAIVNQLRPCPIPSYPTCNPWASGTYNGCNGCGCN